MALAMTQKAKLHRASVEAVMRVSRLIVMGALGAAFSVVLPGSADARPIMSLTVPRRSRRRRRRPRSTTE